MAFLIMQTFRRVAALAGVIRSVAAALLVTLLCGSHTVLAQTFTLTLQPNTIPSGTENQFYSQTITAVGGNAPYTFQVTSGALPVGLNLTSAGLLSGTATTPNNYTFTITATDNDGNTGFRPYTFSIGTQGALGLSPASLPNGTQNVSYSQTVTASGGSGGYVYSISSGALPAGLSLNGSSGAITGTPTGTGASSFTVAVRDSDGNTGSRAYTINIGGNTLTVNPASLPNGTQGSSYSQTISATGGSGPYTFSVASGSLPAGLSLNPGSGDITGTLTGTGPSTFTIRAIDSASNFGTRTYTVNVGTNSLTVNPASLPSGTRGTPYSQNVGASGGTGSYTFAVTAGALPTGLSLNPATGAIAGTPSAPGTFGFTIQATDTNANTGSRGYTVQIVLAPLTVSPATLPAGTQNVAYSQTIGASGGTAPYTFAITSGALPPGLSLDPNSGVLSGTPTLGGAYTFTVQATDSTPNTGARSYTLNVGTNSLTVNPATLPNGSQGTPYNQTVVGSGGTAPYTYSIVAGALPAGLTLNASTGAITGTPSGSGAATFTMQARDGNGNTGARAYAVNIGANTLTINPATLPPAPQGTPYRQTVTATGGATPYTYSVSAGALPPGLSLDASTGLISGTPTTIGTFTFTLFARDPNGNFGSRSYTIGTARLDPTLDPDVRGLVAAQAASARRFAETQVGNVMRHLEGVHDDFDPCAVNVNVTVTTATPRQSIDPFGQNAGPAPAEVWTGDQVARRTPPAEQCRRDRWWAPSWAVWAGGAVELGSTSMNGLTANNKFSTAGVTAGIDWRAHDDLIVGGALGFGSDHTDIGLRGTSSDGRSMSGMIYLSYRPFTSWFVDGVLGYSALSFDNGRAVAIDSSSVTGTRSGGSWFGSLGLSTELKLDPWRVSPYLRAEFMTASLDSYAEQGSTNQALTFGATSFSSASAVLGVRTFYDIATAWGMITPTVRAEYRHALDGGFNQSMYYTDLGPGISYGMVQSAASRNLFTGAFGVRARDTGLTTVDLEYAATAGTETPLTHSFRGTARVGF
jgi:uncharacterized protein YhjY with autotransporter beta-barrel domain